MNETRIIIAGYGGQGILLLGKILAQAAMQEGKRVTFLPAYGAEVRGGTANCMVVVSDEEIGSPFVEQADVLVAMNEPSLRRFEGRLKPRGVMIVNSSLAQPPAGRATGAVSVPFTDIALKLGNARSANMVALGCCAASTQVVALKTISRILQDFAGKTNKQLGEINQQALLAGSKACTPGASQR
ncbi:MAG TPA: 2-oxoacid:acceptor oxidoreductase family protein [Candidatus Omnitrophota bacterium]|nr:2-oxoacid:acceptor oxidoreductase family protein [Candidatus Omnitrophota bacterium]